MTTQTGSPDDKSYVVDGKVIPHVNLTPEMFLDQSTTLFGATGTGKSKLLDHIMNVLKDSIPLWFAFCPTAIKSEELGRRLPMKAIYTSVNMQFLRNLRDRQLIAVATHKCVNRPKVLSSLYQKIPLERKHRIAVSIKHIHRIASMALSAIDSSSDTYAIRQQKRTVIETTERSEITGLVKQAISANKDYLYETDLSHDQEMALKFLYFNPRVCVIFEDCGFDIKRWEKEPQIREMFYQGRHYALTTFSTFQDDKDLVSEFRKNIFNSFFTTSNVAMAYFERAANHFTRQDRVLVGKLSDMLFNPPGAGNYRKMVYIRQSPQPFQWIIAKDFADDDFIVGSQWYHKYFSMLPSASKIDRNNPFLDSFGMRDADDDDKAEDADDRIDERIDISDHLH